MRAVAVLFVASLMLGSCKGSSSGVCNICPNAVQAYNTASCATQGAANHCDDAGIQLKTDQACGATDGGYLACVFTACDEAIDCTRIASY